MSWRIRHEGSPVSLDDLSLPEIVEGLQDGHWEPTDEVMGPDDREWVAIENHPQLAEAAAELEPPPPRTYDDETRLDFNALIDVTLVLLIFFMIVLSLASAMIQLVRDHKGETRRMVRALTVRIGLSILLFIVLWWTWKMGWIEPRGIRG